MSHVVTFAHKPGDSVRLIGLDQPATVTACLVETDGTQYRVVWWWEGTRRCEWLHSFEIKSS